MDTGICVVWTPWDLCGVDTLGPVWCGHFGTGPLWCGDANAYLA